MSSTIHLASVGASPSLAHAPVVLMRAPQVQAANGSGKSWLYASVAAGTHTPAVRLGHRFAAWPSDEVYALIAARVGGASDAELRALVEQLLSRREAQKGAVLAAIAAANA